MHGGSIHASANEGDWFAVGYTTQTELFFMVCGKFNLWNERKYDQSQCQRLLDRIDGIECGEIEES